jgi:hypothetical protein
VLQQADGISCGLHAIRNAFICMRYFEQLLACNSNNVRELFNYFFCQTYKVEYIVNDRVHWYKKLKEYVEKVQGGYKNRDFREFFGDLKWDIHPISLSPTITPSSVTDEDKSETLL